MNTFGQILKITTFGESHGVAIGVIIDGFPAGFKVNIDNIKAELDRRKTGQSTLVSQRKESEKFEILSGIFDGKTTGHPISIIIYNSNHKSKDYNNIKDLFRPNHADLTYSNKYGIRDYRGGGRSSARETTSRVIAGAIAKQFLEDKFKTKIFGYTKQIADIKAKNINLDIIENNIIRTADEGVANDMINKIKDIAGKGDTIGGILECVIKNPLKNLGEPTFGKIKARLADAMLSIGAVQGFEYGAGFDVINQTGVSYNEGFKKDENGNIYSPNNHYAGILGGISTGEDIIFRIAVKPTSSIYKEQNTVDINGNNVKFKIKGRHDPCILPRVAPIVESMTALVLMDLYLINNASK